jgi:hypothetical protein
LPLLQSNLNQIPQTIEKRAENIEIIENSDSELLDLPEIDTEAIINVPERPSPEKAVFMNGHDHTLDINDKYNKILDFHTLIPQRKIVNGRKLTSMGNK